MVGVGPPALRLETGECLARQMYPLSSLLSVIVSEQTLPGGGASLAGDEGRCMRDV